MHTCVEVSKATWQTDLESPGEISSAVLVVDGRILEAGLLLPEAVPLAELVEDDLRALIARL